MYSDKDEKKGVFDRLQMPKIDMDLTEADDLELHHQPIIKITGLEKPTSSVFSRLGGKDHLSDEQAHSFAGILKNATPKAVSTLISLLISMESDVLPKQKARWCRQKNTKISKSYSGQETTSQSGNNGR